MKSYLDINILAVLHFTADLVKTYRIIKLALVLNATRCFSILLKAGADVNSQDYDGWTPLHAAAHWGQEETCKLLVEHMCDMQLKNNAVR